MSVWVAEPITKITHLYKLQNLSNFIRHYFAETILLYKLFCHPHRSSSTSHGTLKVSLLKCQQASTLGPLENRCITLAIVIVFFFKTANHHLHRQWLSHSHRQGALVSDLIHFLA